MLSATVALAKPVAVIIFFLAHAVYWREACVDLHHPGILRKDVWRANEWQYVKPPSERLLACERRITASRLSPKRDSRSRVSTKVKIRRCRLTTG